LQTSASYPELFAAAFGDEAITPARIAMAIASYERTLVADQTPFELGTMTQEEQDGFSAFQSELCTACHVPPTFTNNEFFNIGLRESIEDLGRQNVTGIQEDAGEMKVPSLLNVGLRRSFMHTGRFLTFDDVFDHYNDPAVTNDIDNVPGGGEYNFQGFMLPPMEAFLVGALTDPRVAAEAFPFDRPTMHRSTSAAPRRRARE
jgi:cytochrome c peroxidase